MGAIQTREIKIQAEGSSGGLGRTKENGKQLREREDDPVKVDHLLKLDGAKERLQLIKANLMEEASFDLAVEGCEGVFHTASPVFHNVKDPQTELIDPAVKGTLNVLKSCAKSPSVKRVILTSSTDAVLYNGKPTTPEVVVDETWFSSPDICRENKMWYQLSKTLAEDAAGKFAKENNIDMVALNPAMMIGPLLQPSLNNSSSAISNLINGAQTCPNISMGWIHVKDVANTHIQAFEISSASGRCENDEPFMPVYQVSKEKARNLGIEFIPLEVSLRDTVESLKEKNLINF